ncbi:MAG TPA: WbqC family protein [Bacteroidales bacterium]|nr:WbqC family protein [Bacteroidales bacterium]
MKVAIMQPYFMPYIGYYQLIKAVDVFVYYDDVNFIKQSWINRNRILLDGSEYLFTLELQGASSFKKILEIEVGKNRHKLLKTICQAYKNAPYFKILEPLLFSIFTSTEQNLSKYIIQTQQYIVNYLGIKTMCLLSSELKKDNTLKGQDKIIDICKNLGATTYINSIGGQALYSKEVFNEAGITLKYLKTNQINYQQFKSLFIPQLSIIDILMFNSVAEIKFLLDKYQLV